MLTFDQEQALLRELMKDDAGRDRKKYVYTNDALRKDTLHPYSIWPETNEAVRRIIEGEIKYDELPYDPENEVYKGGRFKAEQDIIIHNKNNEKLCEAQSMRRCLQTECPLFNPEKGLCREFKIAYRR